MTLTAIEERKAHKQELFKRYNVVCHPKRDMLYDIAWDYGHSAGLSEVEGCFADFLPLIQETP